MNWHKFKDKIPADNTYIFMHSYKGFSIIKWNKELLKLNPYVVNPMHHPNKNECTEQCKKVNNTWQACHRETSRDEEGEPIIDKDNAIDVYNDTEESKVPLLPFIHCNEWMYLSSIPEPIKESESISDIVHAIQGIKLQCYSNY